MIQSNKGYINNYMLRCYNQNVNNVQYSTTIWFSTFKWILGNMLYSRDQFKCVNALLSNHDMCFGMTIWREKPIQ